GGYKMSLESIKIKAEQVAVIEDKAKRAKGVVLVDYRGLTVAEDTEMCNNLRKAGVEYKVLKNRLVLRAFNNVGYEGFDKVLEGPTAVAFSYDDATAPARIVMESVKKTNNKISVKGGIVEGKILDANGIVAVSNIPSKEVLLSQLLGLLTSPMRSLAIAVSEVAKKQA
ncbi:MAG: 50S ribosomal protein L10, partial [Clostridia bacterium]|nr:50S ribosomal protein L10 [Clostridia bacterium]